MQAKVLITGGTGLVGNRLTKLLLQKGYVVQHLSRSRNGQEKVKTFLWDVNEQWIEEGALDGVQYIVHLAGASVADHRWTKEQKEVILKSRTDSTRLLYTTIQKQNHPLKAFISSSAVGIYGEDNGAHLLQESSPFGNDFLAQVCKAWEAEADKIEELKVRLVKLRIGVVLSDKGGALKAIQQPTQFGFGSPLGSGEQYVSWIHIDDLCGIIIKAIEDNTMAGVYNAVAPNPEINRKLSKTVAEVLNKPFFAPKVPGFLLKAVLGSERAGIVLGSIRVSSDKIEKAGYNFKFGTLKPALEDLLNQ